jgi:hypothetical protein
VLEFYQKIPEIDHRPSPGVARKKMEGGGAAGVWVDPVESGALSWFRAFLFNVDNAVSNY